VSGPIGLRYDKRDVMTGGAQGAQRRHGEGGGSGEDELQEGS
jgi:hypothetical protein